MKKTKNNNGFTLVELVVVMSIFGIIMGALLNLMKPANEVYNSTDATLQTNLEGTAIVNYIDDNVRYATNILVLKDYVGVPVVSTSGTIGSDGVSYDGCIIIDNKNLRGYSESTYSGDDTDTAQKRMGATGCVINVKDLSTKGLDLNNSEVANGVDFYGNYKFEIAAAVSNADKMYNLDLSISAYQPKHENGTYTFEQTRFTKEASVNLKNINLDEGDSYSVRGYVDFSTAADYTTYPRQTTAPAGATTQQQTYYGTDADNTYTYIFYDKTTISDSAKYTVKFIYAASGNVNPGAEISSPSVTAGTLFKNPPTLNPVVGHTTPYWLDESGNVVDFSAGVTINKDMVFSAVYPPDAGLAQHSVEYKKIDGSTYQITTDTYEGSSARDIGAPDDMDTIKQKFLGWFTGTNGTGDSISSVVINDDYAVFYPYVENNYEMQFEIDGTIDAALTSYVERGSMAVAPATTPVSSDADKIFDYWEGTDSTGTFKITDRAPDGNCTFVAVFKDKPVVTADPDKIIFVINCADTVTSKYMYINGYGLNVEVKNITTNTVLTSFTHNQMHLDISADAGTARTYVVTTSFCYSEKQAEDAEINIWNSEWQRLLNCFKNPLDASNLGNVYYYTVS